MQASKKNKGTFDHPLKNEMGVPSQTPVGLELAEAHSRWKAEVRTRKAKKGPEFRHWQNKSACAAL